MKRFFRLYHQLLRSNAHAFWTYRADAVTSMFSSIAWGVFSVVAVSLITTRVSSVAGWVPEELMLLALTYGIIVSFFHAQFSHNFGEFAGIIHQGELDTYLLKPMPAYLLLSIRQFRFASTIRILLASGGIIWLAARYGMQITPLSILEFMLLGIVGNAMLYAIHLFFATLLIWNSYLSNIMDFTGVATGTARYPADMIKKAPFVFEVFFLPLLLVVSVPTKVLIGKGDLQEIILFCTVTVMLLVAAIQFWKWSLQSYTGASR